MKLQLSVRHSKLMVSTAAHTLDRARLTRKMSAILQKKLTLVVAGAGYGKTTLVAQCITEIKTPVVWYSLDETDSDLPMFLRYLIEGIRLHYPDFASGILRDGFEQHLSPAHLDTFLTVFLTEIERTTSDALVVVLDDYHLLDADSPVHAALSFLLNRSAAGLHVVIISRSEPPLSITRLRAMLAVVDVGEADLAFDLEEIARLYQTQLKTSISRRDMATLHETTGGWAAGLVLFHHAARGRSANAIGSDLLALGNSKDYIFSYLKENIFDRIEKDQRDFMIKSATFDRLSPDLCDIIFGRRNSRQILETLCRDHLLTFKIEDEKAPYRYHHLLLEFLRHQLGETVSADEIRQIHVDAGRAMEEIGDLPGAMHHYLKGNQLNDICRLADNMMMQDVMACSFLYMARVLEKLPADLLRKNPRLVYFQAKLASVQGRVQPAIGGLKQALVQFRVQKDATGISNCLKDLGFHYYLTGDIRRARKQMAMLWGRPHPDPFFPLEVAGQLILFCAILGDFDAADDYYDKVQRFTAGAPPVQKALAEYWLNLCYAYRWYYAGKFEKAYRINANALDGFNHSGFVVFLPLAYFQAALTSFYRNHHQTGTDYAEKGLHVARQVGFNDSVYAWLLYSRALNALAGGDAQRAMDDARQALHIFSSHGNSWGQASVYEIMAMVYQIQNDVARVKSYLLKGLDIIDGRGLVVTRAALTLRLAQLYVDQDDHVAACRLIDDQGCRFSINRFHQFLVHRLRAQIAAAENRHGAAADHLAEALGIAHENQYDVWVLQGNDRVLAILADCHGKDVMRPYIEKIVAAADSGIQQQFVEHTRSRARIDVAADVMPLDIRCLGPFKVFLGNREIPDKSWRSVNVRRLFQYLALKNQQGFIPKDVLLELLWPGEDPQKTNRRFHVTMTSLRKVLEPDLKRGEASGYLLRQSDAYRLNCGQNGRIDFIDFLEQCRHAQAAAHPPDDDGLAFLLSIAALYDGPVFQEEPYVDWFIEDREWVQAQYLELIATIVRAYEEREDWEACIPWANSHLAIDRYAEPIYRVLMRCHFYLGDMARSISTFERCEQMITTDLDCPLNPRTTALYRNLIAMTQN
ncbi:putative transcriptional activator domain protein [Desulfosarcina variabilis str. Montpellier]|uniref:BTAD domain-containing putative transcriptional regulator n=1 Tax=Desulfosarcina variabilis TaxID=2300 RepID=UPI003AFA58AC